MRAYNFNVGLASSCLIISAQALPRLLLPKHEMDGFFKPRDYKVYEQPATINKYTYGGYGPAPTLSYPGSSTSKTTSEVPEQTSSLIFSSTSSSSEPTVYYTSSLKSAEPPAASLYGTASTLLHSSSQPISQETSLSSVSDIHETSLVRTSLGVVGTTTYLYSSSQAVAYESLSLGYSKGSSGQTVSSAMGVVTSLPSSSHSTLRQTSLIESPGLASGRSASSTGITMTSNYNTSQPILSKTTSSTFVESPSHVTAVETNTMKCYHNNCLRQMIRQSSLAAQFCSTYTKSISTKTTDLPVYVSNCKNLPSAISLACSCLGPNPTSLTYEHSLASNPLSSRSTQFLVSTTHDSVNSQQTHLASGSFAPYPILNATSGKTGTGYLAYPTGSLDLIYTSSVSSLREFSTLMETSALVTSSSSNYVDSTRTPHPTTVHLTSLITVIVSGFHESSSVDMETSKAPSLGASFPQYVSSFTAQQTNEITTSNLLPSTTNGAHVSSVSGAIPYSTPNFTSYPVYNSTSLTASYVNTSSPSTASLDAGKPSSIPSTAPYLNTNGSSVYHYTQTGIIPSSTVSRGVGTSSETGIYSSKSHSSSSSGIPQIMSNTSSVAIPTHTRSPLTTPSYSPPGTSYLPEPSTIIGSSSAPYDSPSNSSSQAGTAGASSYSTTPISTASDSIPSSSLTATSGALFSSIKMLPSSSSLVLSAPYYETSTRLQSDSKETSTSFISSSWSHTVGTGSSLSGTTTFTAEGMIGTGSTKIPEVDHTSCTLQSIIPSSTGTSISFVGTGVRPYSASSAVVTAKSTNGGVSSGPISIVSSASTTHSTSLRVISVPVTGNTLTIYYPYP